ncbi:MAG: rhodanese-like domain-containing protein [Lentisphaerae bacterium]|nr:rhodanese-like domain-containing protein [Lentisphaerota bacterium]
MTFATRMLGVCAAGLLSANAWAGGACCASAGAEQKTASTDAAPAADQAASTSSPDASKGTTTISPAVLKDLLDAKQNITVVDARSAKYDDGNRLPGAMSLTADAADEEISKALPSKDAPIIAYCSNLQCPASHKLAERLQRLGYQRVKIMPEGIAGWQEAGYPVDKAE